MDNNIVRRTLAEGAGTAGLVLTVFGSSHFATNAGASPAESAIIGTLAVVGTFVCVLHAVGSLTGGHINPAVTISFLSTGKINRRDALLYVLAQFVGAIGGALTANLIWGSAVISLGRSSVTGNGYIAECLAAGGLVAVIHGSVRGGNAGRLPFVVPSFIAAASFAAPFGFANPAVAIAKTIAGHGPSYLNLAGLVACEAIAAIAAAQIVKSLYHDPEAGKDPAAPPLVANTFHVTCSPSSEDAVSSARTVMERIIRPTDFVVRHHDGRLLVQLDSSDDRVRSSLEDRVNRHLNLMALASGTTAPAVTIQPIATSNLPA